MTQRPHPIPFATVGQTIRYKNGNKHESGTVEQVATGHGWHCYLVNRKWVGHEVLTA